MRSTGILKTWHEERGFGFIAPAVGGSDVFVHASALTGDFSAIRPTVGETLFYEVVLDGQGQPQAVGVGRTWAASTLARRAASQPRRRSRGLGRRLALAFGIVALAVLGAFGYARYVLRGAHQDARASSS